MIAIAPVATHDEFGQHRKMIRVGKAEDHLSGRGQQRQQRLQARERIGQVLQKVGEQQAVELAE